MAQFVKAYGEYGVTFDGNTLSVIYENNSIQIQYPSNISDSEIDEMLSSFVKINPSTCKKLQFIRQKCIDAGFEYNYEEEYSSGAGRNPDSYTDKNVTIGPARINLGGSGYCRNLDNMDTNEISEYIDTIIDIIKCKNEYVECLKQLSNFTTKPVSLIMDYSEVNPIACIEINECRQLKFEIDIIEKTFGYSDYWHLVQFGMFVVGGNSVEASIENIKKIIELEKSIMDMYNLLKNNTYCRIPIYEKNRIKLMKAYQEYEYLESKFDMAYIRENYYVYVSNDEYCIQHKNDIPYKKAITYGTFEELCDYLMTIKK